MRIIVFAGYYFPHKGGVERYVRELYRRLAERGIEVVVVTCNTDNAPPEEVLDGVKVYRMDCWDALGGTFPIPKVNRRFWKVFRRLNKTSYTLVNTQTRFFIHAFLGFLYGKIRGIRIIHTEHGTRHSFLANPVVRLFSKLYDHTIGYIVTKFVNDNVAISEASGEFSRHLGAKRYEIIYNGIDIGKFTRRQTDLKSRLSIPPEDKIITFLGRLIEAKGVQDLIAVFKEVQKNKKLKLLIVGMGNYLPELKRCAGEENDIFFLGEKPEEEVIDILSITDIFVNPSYSEGLPTSVLEAAACGCPVIASDVGGTREIIHDGENGLLFRPGNRDELRDKLRLLLEDSPLREHLSSRARETVCRRFDWEMIARGYMSYLKTMAVSSKERDTR